MATWDKDDATTEALDAGRETFGDRWAGGWIDRSRSPDYPWIFCGVNLGEARPSEASVSLGMDAVHNALCLRLRWLDQAAIEHVRTRLPADALRIEIEPRAGYTVAY